MSLLPYGSSPGGSGLIWELLHLAPRAKYTWDQFKSILPHATGPLVSPNYGASSRTAQFVDPSQRPTNNALGSVLGIAGQLGQYIKQQNDPMTQLYNQLLDSLSNPVQGPTGINRDDLMQQVQSALNPIYDQRAQKAQAQNSRAQTDIKGMYQALANDYKQLAPQQEAQAKQDQQQIADIYGQLRSNIQGNYGRVAQDQQDLFNKLGIQDALPDVQAQQQAQELDATQAASELQAQQQQRYQDIGSMDATYYRQGSPNAIMAGNEYGTALLNKLSDYLNQNEAERTSGIQSAFMDQLGQAQNQLMQQQQMANSQEQQRQQMLWQILSSQMQGGQQQKLTPDTFMGSLSPQEQQAVGSAFTQLERSPEAVYGKVQDPRSPVPGTFVNTTPQWYMSQADQMLQNGQIDEATHQALLMYLQLYFGNGSGGS